MRSQLTRIDSNSSVLNNGDVYDTIRPFRRNIGRLFAPRRGRNPIEIAMGLPKRDLASDRDAGLNTRAANALPGNRTVVELGDVVRLTRSSARLPSSAATAISPTW